MAGFHLDDTIAAVSTAMAPAGIGIVRISGNDAFEVADRVFRAKKEGKKLSAVKSHTIHYGWITEGEEVIDEVLVMVMKGPKTYTGENTVEIDCHGGVLAVKKVLEAVLNAGARAADPGEFTKRAFLNGRMDLTQAEAVMDVISAKSAYALKSSESQLRGTVKKAIRAIREKLIYEIAFIGKSSLLNLLAGEEKAIVTDIAGTTRDVLEENLVLKGISLRILDTAGIRKTADTVEKIGVDRALEHAKDADLILYVVDASVPLDENDAKIMEILKGRKAIVLLNKSDLTAVIEKEEMEQKTGAPVISISAREETGMEELEEQMKKMFFQGEISFNDEVYITNARHKQALLEAKKSLELTAGSIEMGMPEDFFSIDLMNAYEELGSIIGEAVGEDLVNEIFSKFCTGK